MEPQHNYRQSWEARSEETSFSTFSPRPEKINVRKGKGTFIFTGALQCILLAFSFYMSLAISDVRTESTLLINTLFVNVSFFIVAWVNPHNQTTGRRILYSCLAFILTIVLLYSSTISISSDAGATGDLLLPWGIILLLDAVLYLLAKYLPSISI